MQEERPACGDKEERAVAVGQGKGCFEDRVTVMPVKNGLGQAELALGPGVGVGDLLSLFPLTLQSEMEKNLLQHIDSLRIFFLSVPQ